MEIDLEKQLNEFVNDLIDRRGDLPNALKKLKDEYELSEKSNYLLKLPKLIYHLTRVTKKKTIRAKYELSSKRAVWKNKTAEIGINSNGLGIVDWGSQLSPLATSYELNNGYNIDDGNFLVLMGIFNDEELCLDIAQEILQSRRKDFLKLASFFRNKDFMPENLSREKDFGNIKIGFNYNWDIDFVRCGNEGLSWHCLKFIRGLDNFEVIKYCRLGEFLDLKDVLDKKDEIEKFIQDRGKALMKQRDSQKELNEFVGDMILSYEALEKL